MSGLSSLSTRAAVSCHVKSTVNRQYGDAFQGLDTLIKCWSCEVLQQPWPKPLSNIKTAGWNSAAFEKGKIGKRGSEEGKKAEVNLDRRSDLSSRTSIYNNIFLLPGP